MISVPLFEPPVPPAWIAAAVFAAGALAVASYARQGGGRLFRALLALARVGVLAALGVILMRPLRETPKPAREGRPFFVVLADASASMKTADAGEGRTRAEAVRAALRGSAALRGLGKAAEVRVRTFDAGVREAGIRWLEATNAPEGLRSDLAAALAETGSLEPNRECAGVLLLSDGRDNGGGQPLEAAMVLKGRQVPVWTVCVGTPKEAVDVHLNARLSQPFLFVNQTGTLGVTISQSGFDKWHVNVHLHREGRYVATRQAVLGGSSTRLEFPVREDRKGLFRYRVTLDPLPGEGDLQNNGRTLFVRATDEKARILLVEAKPYWDSKFLLRTLQDDVNLNVTTVFALSPTKLFGIRETLADDLVRKESREGPPELPRTRAELDPYDCVILGRGVEELLPEETLALFRGYVEERGGSLVFFRGRAGRGSDALAALEPMVWEEESLRNVKLDLTPDGQASPIFSFSRAQPPELLIRSMPPLISVTRVRQTRSLAVVLATGRESAGTQEVAAVAYQRMGKGKVMSIAPAGLWRWAFMPADQDEFRDVYKLFWGQMVRWLVSESDFLPGQDISFHVSRHTCVPGQPVQLSVSTKNVDPAQYRPTITVKEPGGGRSELVPLPAKGDAGAWQVLYTPLAEGEYSAVLTGNAGEPRELEACFMAYSDMVETRFTASDEGLMAAIAEQTGGAALTLAELDTLPGKVEAFALQASRWVDREDAWDEPWVFLALAGALAFEWFLRRRAGLV